MSTSNKHKYDKNIEYAIGIDLGHGETSVAICPIQWECENNSSREAPTDMDMGSNRKVIPSAITIMKNGDAYIGEAAFKSERLQNAAESHLCFKQMPKDINGDAEKIMIRYMHEVYHLIRERNQALLTDDNHIVAIATPSGWPSDAMNLYKEMARTAGMPVDFVIKESRAALIKAQKTAASGMARNISKGAIVFDMGSSTLDFTYLNSNNAPIDYGYDCGASKVEKTMFEKLEEQAPVLKEFLVKYPELAATMLFKTREVKEKIYFEPDSQVKVFVNLDEFVDNDEDFEDERVKLLYKPNELNRLLEEVGYIGTIAHAMQEFKENHIKNMPIYGVLLTGGASRMNFIWDLVKKYWNVEDNQIYRDQDPSLTISQGVAEASRADVLTSGNDNLNDEIQTLIHNDDIYEAFVVGFGRELYSKTIDAINDSLDNFVNSSNDISLGTFRLRLSSNIRKAVSETSQLTGAYMEQAIMQASEDLRGKVDNVISYYSASGTKVEPPTIDVENVSVDGINLDDAMKEVASTINAESSNWSGMITGGAIGGAIAMLLGGPLAWMIGGAALIGKYLFGETKTEEEKRKDAMNKKLDASERQQVYNAIGEKSDEITNNVAESIEESLRSNSKIKSAVKRVTREVLTEYKNKLQEARIIID